MILRVGGDDNANGDETAGCSGICHGEAGRWGPEIAEWAPSTLVMLDSCATGLARFDDMKKVFARLFDDQPGADPHARREGWTVLDSAEECARAYKAMLYGVRECSLDGTKLQAMLRQISDPEAKEAAMACVKKFKEKAPKKLQKQTSLVSVGSSEVEVEAMDSDWGEIELDDMGVLSEDDEVRHN